MLPLLPRRQVKFWDLRRLGDSGTPVPASVITTDAASAGVAKAHGVCSFAVSSCASRIAVSYTNSRCVVNLGRIVVLPPIPLVVSFVAASSCNGFSCAFFCFCCCLLACRRICLYDTLHPKRLLQSYTGHLSGSFYGKCVSMLVLSGACVIVSAAQ